MYINTFKNKSNYAQNCLTVIFLITKVKQMMIDFLLNFGNIYGFKLFVIFICLVFWFANIWWTWKNLKFSSIRCSIMYKLKVYPTIKKCENKNFSWGFWIFQTFEGISSPDFQWQYLAWVLKITLYSNKS